MLETKVTLREHVEAQLQSINFLKGMNPICHPIIRLPKMRKLFNSDSNWLLHWGFPDDRGLVKNDLS